MHDRGSAVRYGKQIHLVSDLGGAMAPQVRIMDGRIVSQATCSHGSASTSTSAHCCMRGLKCKRPHATPEAVMPMAHGDPNSPATVT